MALLIVFDHQGGLLLRNLKSKSEAGRMTQNSFVFHSPSYFNSSSPLLKHLRSIAFHSILFRSPFDSCEVYKFVMVLGIALMMWNTFIVKRLSSATYLMDKVSAVL